MQVLVFAGDAFTQLPITSDYISAKMFLESIDPSLISKQGTAIGAAIKLSTHSFTPQEGVGRAVIVITDGENHEGGAVEAAKAATEKGIQVNVLGVGHELAGNVKDFQKSRNIFYRWFSYWYFVCGHALPVL